ncbi:hypothetical protein Tery_1182 [Trichodesmium erythraeum IMS101]|uniref:Uncharacterized protein n=1 Tax=Trichodesmium erythraeum (strain IMS101) TaxID=203124 RepID=Q116N4_TRIEI|nr:hypothetical protein [Trichodesmium erythraeum GBRTRLIN201]
MPNCPVCNTEYQQQQVNFCLKCGWYLRLYSNSGDEVLEGSGFSSSDALQKVEKWAIQKLHVLKKQESQLKQLRAKYEELQAELQQSQQERSRLKSELDDYTEKYNQLQT